MKNTIALVLACILLLGLIPLGAGAEELAPSDVPGMTASGVLPIATEPVTITIGLMPNATVTDYEDNHFTKYLEEKTGINIEFYFFPSNSTEAQQKLELMVSSRQKLPDIIVGIPVSDAAKYSYGSQGVILDLEPYFEKYGHFFYESAGKWCSDLDRYNMDTYSRAANGRQYVFPILYADPGNLQQGGFYINDTWLQTLGLERPTTAEAFREVLSAFRDGDPNGNGKADEIPAISAVYSGITPHDVATILINSFVYYNPRYPMNVEDGKVYAPWTTDAYRQALTFCREMMDEGLISPLSFTQDSTQLKSILERDDTGSDVFVGAFTGHPSSLFGSSSATRTNYSALAPLEGTEGVAFAIINPSGLNYYNMITADCEHPEIAFRLLDFMCEEEAALTSRWGQKGVDWDYTQAGDTRQARYASLGFPLYYEYFNNPYLGDNNLIWKCDAISFLPAKLFGSMPMPHIEGDDNYNYGTEMYAQSVGLRWGKNPSELVTRLIYTEDEMAVLAEMESTITSYVEECRVRFVMGDMDIAKEWDSYLKALDSMGLADYITTVQTAYTRMNEGK